MVKYCKNAFCKKPVGPPNDIVKRSWFGFGPEIIISQPYPDYCHTCERNNG